MLEIAYLNNLPGKLPIYMPSMCQVGRRSDPRLKPVRSRLQGRITVSYDVNTPLFFSKGIARCRCRYVAEPPSNVSENSRSISR